VESECESLKEIARLEEEIRLGAHPHHFINQIVAFSVGFG